MSSYLIGGSNAISNKRHVSKISMSQNETITTESISFSKKNLCAYYDCEHKILWANIQICKKWIKEKNTSVLDLKGNRQTDVISSRALVTERLFIWTWSRCAWVCERHPSSSRIVCVSRFRSICFKCLTSNHGCFPLPSFRESYSHNNMLELLPWIKHCIHCYD